MQSAEPAKRGGNGVATRQVGAGPKAGTAPIDFRMFGEFIGETCLPNRFADEEIGAAIQGREQTLLPFGVERSAVESSWRRKFAAVFSGSS